MSPVPAAAVLAALAATALLADRWLTVAVIAALLLVLSLRTGRGRPRLLYLFGASVTALSVFLLTPFVETIGSHVLWTGPTIPVVGTLDVTSEELGNGAVAALRLLAVSLAFAAYALALDHDRLVHSARIGRRSALLVALATRLVPTLERDAAGLLEAMRGRGVHVNGARGHARLLSPLLAGSLERASLLAEAMEARGYGQPGATRVPRPKWTHLDHAALATAATLVVAGTLWL
jgi:energy-coupling factor transport system permease protein